MPKVGFISKEQFETNVELKAQYGSYESYCKNLLSSTSIHSFSSYQQQVLAQYSARLDAHNQIGAELINRYKGLEVQYNNIKRQNDDKIGKLMSSYEVSSQGDLTKALSGSLYDSSVFANANKSTSEARINYEAALSTALSFTHQIVT